MFKCYSLCRESEKNRLVCLHILYLYFNIAYIYMLFLNQIHVLCYCFFKLSLRNVLSVHCVLFIVLKQGWLRCKEDVTWKIVVVFLLCMYISLFYIAQLKLRLVWFILCFLVFFYICSVKLFKMCIIITWYYSLMVIWRQDLHEFVVSLLITWV